MPEEKGGGPSMFETVKNHEERIQVLEEAEKKHEERLKTLEEQSMKLENTIMAENRETRSTMKEQTEKLFTIVEHAMGYQSNKTAQDHELKVLKWNTISTILLKLGAGILTLLSSGSLIYYFVTKLF